MENHKKKIFQLNPYNLPLYGQRLIEASAGTGKTYTIALLYLRLLLKIGNKYAFFKRLNVKEILVLTFTESATNELRARIRHNIHQMRIACMRNGFGFSKESIYQILLVSIVDRHAAAKWLLSAEHQMDEAAIYTIHGFCRSILSHNALESRMLFKQSIIKNESILQKQACFDFWRSNCYPLEYCISKIIADEWSGPEALLDEIKPYLQGEVPVFLNKSIKFQSITKHHKIIINTINIIKKLWMLHLNDFFSLIINSGINKRVYNRRNLLIWLDIVTTWAKSHTIDYKTPKELVRFSQLELINKTSIDNEIPKHEVFCAIDKFLKKTRTLRNIFISKAIIDVRKIIMKEKTKRQEIGFDDLLDRLEYTLNQKNNKRLKNMIRNRYPVVMIDEYQDTDSKQNKIFKSIYDGHQYSGIFFIGDPKQAIYSFRGADIFSYIKAKNKIQSHYKLDTNWRSSSNMVAAINHLFSRVKNPFLFKQIPFHVVNSGYANQNLGLIHKKEKVSALNFNYFDKDQVSTTEYQKIMAYQCASQIYYWLIGGDNRTTWLYKNDQKKILTASDIMILVRNRRESKIIQEELRKFNISSVFLSNYESVFSTSDARDLLWLLQAVLSPEKEETLRRSLATSLMGLSAKEIEEFNKNDNELEIWIREFHHYSLIWERYGISAMFRCMIHNQRIAKHLLKDNTNGERRLMDVMHLFELLQESELEFDNKHAIIRWLAQKIDKPDPLLENQQRRLESNKNFISISTIHKSKGLEYPIVWLPFICQFSQKKLAIFHERKNFQICLDLTDNPKSLKLADEERLAEDLRLLYVALTRAIYHCSVGIAPLYKKRHTEKTCNTDLHKSALGYLLQKGKQGNATLLFDNLRSLVNKHIGIKLINNIKIFSSYCCKKNRVVKLLAKNFSGKIDDIWRVTSYSKLKNNDIFTLSNKVLDNNLNFDLKLQNLNFELKKYQYSNNYLYQKKESKKNVYTFPKGVIAGNFMHSILEVLPFNKVPKESWLIERLEAVGFSSEWASMLKIWLINIFNVPLIEDNFKLSNILSEHRLNEMKFCFSIKNILHPSLLDNLAHRYDVLSKNCPPLNFEQVKGVLKGYIDLIVFWKKKFYLIDYKSNWLGEDSFAYNQQAIKKSMIYHRYDLQYQLYTLAIHRYLRNRVPDYDYKTHFGGVIYLFLRGIYNKNSHGYGIYYNLPVYSFIDSLDKLFGVS
ncbi:exodeoxyribonuclease V subunit beta [Arsenophonus symbiont of Ornithomya chloropus]|uniref:exodeoxyribonuclease V subunit beta n=1 Tax=Arsenophonus symbiont of Ornithomya chloropus TaxID=634121 RepID=UPI0032B13E8F